MALNIDHVKAKNDDLDRSLKTKCLRLKADGTPCQMRPLYQAGVGHQDDFGCWRHATDEEKLELEKSRMSIETKTGCPGCKAGPGEACLIPTEEGLTPAQAGLTMVDGEWPRVRVLGGVDIHVPRIELIHPDISEPFKHGADRPGTASPSGSFDYDGTVHRITPRHPMAPCRRPVVCAKRSRGILFRPQ